MDHSTTEIIIERDDLIVFRRREQIEVRCCNACGIEVEMLPPEMAAVASGVSARGIYRVIEEGLLHFEENAVGLLLLCSQSLGQMFPMNSTERFLLAEAVQREASEQ